MARAGNGSAAPAPPAARRRSPLRDFFVETILS